MAPLTNRLMIPPSITDAFNAYSNHLIALGKKPYVALTRTALLRYTAPGWDLVISGERLKPEDIDRG
jgi:hypothetical protein